MVLVTLPPAIAAPPNSNMVAMMIAVPTVMAPEPTDVPMALATSLAPMPHVINKPRTIAMESSKVPFVAMNSIKTP